MTTEKQTIIEQQFDSFCKTVIRNAALDFYRAHMRLASREIPFSQLTKEMLEELSLDEEGAPDARPFWVPVLNTQVDVRDVRLGDALDALAPRNRQVLLLSFFLNMNNTEVGKLLRINPVTVAMYKSTAVRLLKELMEDEAHD